MNRYVVPWRSDGGRRDVLWKFCKAWWKDAAITPVEAPSPVGEFNRGAAINAAAGGEWDVLVILDADVVCDAEQVKAAAAHALATGRMTLAYDRYVALGQQMTERVLEGHAGSWSPGAKLRMRSHVSSVVCVPRNLWDRVGGFDERFVGWGHDDTAFAAACRVLGGGIERVPGEVFHLWHTSQFELNRRQPGYRASIALAQRYFAALEPNAMRKLVRERSQPDGVCLVIVTDGRRECIRKAIASADKHLHGLPITHRIICDDSGDADYQAWLRLHFGHFELHASDKRRGFAGAVAGAWDIALGSGQRWVFWLEDDFTFTRDVNLAQMAHVLDANPHILQMALQRQAWSKVERKAGGVVERNPDSYLERMNDEARWLEHKLFWTTNPSLIPRHVLAEYTWPRRPGSERLFARDALQDGNVSGYWGTKNSPPAVHHEGVRIGKGY